MYQINGIERSRKLNKIKGLGHLVILVILNHHLFYYRSAGSKLNNADDVTRKLWREAFGVSFARPGSMFRGNPPQGRLHALSETYQKALLLPREMDVQIDKIQVSSLPADHPLPEEAVLSISLEIT